MTRHKWMYDLVGDIADNIGRIFEYAKENMRTQQNYDEIKKITDLVKNDFEK